MANHTKVSLSHELDELTDAIDAARMLADYLHQERMDTPEDATRAPRMIAAVLNIVLARMRLLTRAVQGAVDSGILAAGFNRATEHDSIVLVVAPHVLPLFGPTNAQVKAHPG
jgi:hypothetical protein